MKKRHLPQKRRRLNINSRRRQVMRKLQRKIHRRRFQYQMSELFANTDSA